MSIIHHIMIYYIVNRIFIDTFIVTWRKHWSDDKFLCGEGKALSNFIGCDGRIYFDTKRVDFKRAHDAKAFLKLFAVTFQLDADEEVLAVRWHHIAIECDERVETSQWKKNQESIRMLLSPSSRKNFSKTDPSSIPVIVNSCPTAE